MLWYSKDSIWIFRAQGKKKIVFKIWKKKNSTGTSEAQPDHVAIWDLIFRQILKYELKKFVTVWKLDFK